MSGSDRVQEVLDSVFEVQERLFRWRDPHREPADDSPEPDPAIRLRLLVLLAATPSQRVTDLYGHFNGGVQSVIRSELDYLEAAGAIVAERAADGRSAKRYSVATTSAEEACRG